MTISEVEKNFANVLNDVYARGITVELERGHKVIARLIPAEPPSPLTIGGLVAFLRSLPSLGDDDESFAKDIHAIRAPILPETNP